MNTDLAENQAGNQEDKQKKLMDQYNKMTSEIDNYDETKRCVLDPSGWRAPASVALPIAAI